MKVTITEYATLPSDANGFEMPMAGRMPTARQVKTAAGDLAAFSAGTTFVRIATDTAIQINLASTTVGSAGELMPANTVEYFPVAAGATGGIALA